MRPVGVFILALILCDALPAAADRCDPNPSVFSPGGTFPLVGAEEEVGRLCSVSILTPAPGDESALAPELLVLVADDVVIPSVTTAPVEVAFPRIFGCDEEVEGVETVRVEVDYLGFEIVPVDPLPPSTRITVLAGGLSERFEVASFRSLDELSTRGCDSAVEEPVLTRCSPGYYECMPPAEEDEGAGTDEMSEGAGCSVAVESQGLPALFLLILLYRRSVCVPQVD